MNNPGSSVNPKYLPTSESHATKFILPTDTTIEIYRDVEYDFDTLESISTIKWRKEGHGWNGGEKIDENKCKL